MNKIIYRFFVLIGIFIITSASYSQDKVFLSSEDAYVSVVEYTDWNAEHTTEYFGTYEFIYPGQTPSGDYLGDIVQEKILISFNNGEINLYKNMIVESDWEQKDTIKNLYFFSNYLIPVGIELTEKDKIFEFVTLKYADPKGNTKSSRGILFQLPESKDFAFYEKLRD
ncbi:MAG TPA: hypothetical protein VHP32_11520 [Ignavibacteria bacterium]|nr:hypothetical protein [Ignavibacteria bacterium]